MGAEKTDSEYINEELIETVYLYCYKRLTSSQDAEDLAQEILLEAVKALNSDKKPDCFYPWFWSMAKNRLNMFLRMKKYNAAKLVTADEYLSADDCIDDSIIKAQEISELNYAVSRLSRIHREIIILYYLKEMKISEIAAFLNLPEGTVKRRLHDAKSDVKKGVTAMKSYGKSAYAPAELNLWGGYCIPNYWDNISDIMTKQIFVTCAKRAKTLQQIADEIGVAPVYFEEKLKYLLENRFLKESTKGAYLTDFCIFPAQKWDEFHFALSDVYENIGKEVTEVILAHKKEIRALGFYGSDFPMGRLLWILYYDASDMLARNMSEIYDQKWQGKIPDGNGKKYRISGCVTYPDENFPRKPRRNSVCWSNLHDNFKTSGYSAVSHSNLFEMRPFPERTGIINEANADLFMRIFDNPNLTLTPNEEETAANLIKSGYLEKRNGGIYPTMPVISFENKAEIANILKRATEELAFKYAQKVGEVCESILLPYIREDLTEEFVHFAVRGAFFPMDWVCYYGLNATPAPLDIPPSYENSSNAICIYFRK